MDGSLLNNVCEAGDNGSGSDLKDLHRNEQKKWTAESFVMFVRHVMMVEVNELESLHQSEQKKWAEEWFIIFAKHVMIVDVSWWKYLHQ